MSDLNQQVVRRLDFPAYCIRVLDNGLLAITGGGGTSKTGVGNSIELGFLDLAHHASSNSSSGGNGASGAFEAQFKLMHKFETNDAIMKFVSFTFESKQSGKSGASSRSRLSSTTGDEKLKPADQYLAGLLDNSIEIYKLEPSLDKLNVGNNNKNEIEYQATALVKRSCVIPFENTQNETLTSIQVCKQANKPHVLICAGTSKGSIHVWSVTSQDLSPPAVPYPTSRLKYEHVHEFKSAHDVKEVDGLEVNVVRATTTTSDKQAKSGNSAIVYEHHLLSIGRDHKCMLWSLDKFIKLGELLYTKDNTHRMNKARFSANHFLFTSYVPRIRGGSKSAGCSYICRWRFYDPNQLVSSPSQKNSDINVLNSSKIVYKREVLCSMENTILTSMKCSKDGYFVCAGDSEGKIYLFDFNLNKLVNFKQTHSACITDVEFYYDQFLPLDNDLDGETNNKASHSSSSTDAQSLISKPTAVDLNKLIVTIGIDRTLQLYKYISSSASEVNRFLEQVDRCESPFRTKRKLTAGANSNDSGLLSLFSCCLSMNMFNLALFFLLFAVLISYFFVNIE